MTLAVEHDVKQQINKFYRKVLHVGNIQIQMVQLKYFEVPLPKEIFVMTV